LSDDTILSVVATDKMEVPGVGILAYRKDPEGNIFGVLQAVGFRLSSKTIVPLASVLLLFEYSY
jgi:hypothetical protein